MRLRVLREFGRFLRGLRGEKSIREIEQAAKRMGLRLPRGTIGTYESGFVAAIGRVRLEALAQVYGQSLETVIREYVEDRFGVDFRRDHKCSEPNLYPDPVHANLHKDLQTILVSGDAQAIQAVSFVVEAVSKKVEKTRNLETQGRSRHNDASRKTLLPEKKGGHRMRPARGLAGTFSSLGPVKQ